jgi:hypothetical protein
MSIGVRASSWSSSIDKRTLFDFSYTRMEVIKPVGKLLPPFNATFYSEDGQLLLFLLGDRLISSTVPYQFFSYDAKNFARIAAQTSSVRKL